MGVLQNIFKGENMTIKGNDAYGMYHGFPVAVRKKSDNNGLLMQISFAGIDNEEKLSQLQASVLRRGTELKTGLKTLLECEIKNGYMVELHIQKAFRDKTVVEESKEALDAIIRLLNSVGCLSGCSLCGQPVNVSWYAIENNIPICICDECKQKVLVACEERDEKQRAIQVDYVKGTLAALAGALVAAVVYALMLRAGYILMSVFLPFIPLLCFIGAGKKVDKVGAIICAIISLTVFYFATKFGYIWRVQSQVFDSYSIREVWDMMNELITEYPQVKKVYMEVMIKGYGIAALVSVIMCGMAFFDKGVTKVKRL